MGGKCAFCGLRTDHDMYFKRIKNAQLCPECAKLIPHSFDVSKVSLRQYKKMAKIFRLQREQQYWGIYNGFIGISDQSVAFDGIDVRYEDIKNFRIFFIPKTKITNCQYEGYLVAELETKDPNIVFRNKLHKEETIRLTFDHRSNAYYLPAMLVSIKRAIAYKLAHNETDFAKERKCYAWMLHKLMLSRYEPEKFSMDYDDGSDAAREFYWKAAENRTYGNAMASSWTRNYYASLLSRN